MIIINVHDMFGNCIHVGTQFRNKLSILVNFFDMLKTIFNIQKQLIYK